MTWTPPNAWHLKRKKHFRVTIKTQEITEETDLGGVTLRPQSNGLIYVESRGEDALDSLGYALNQYLTEPYDLVSEEIT